MSYRSGDPTIGNGAFSASAYFVHMVEWDAGADAALAGGGCLDVRSVDFLAGP